MDISKYSAFFHDGSVISIRHDGDNMQIYMESAEISDGDLEEFVQLSCLNRIKGCLHINGIKEVKIGSKKTRKLEMNHDSGSIFELSINQSSVELSIEWCNFPPKKKTADFSIVKIEGKKIWWENIPNLYDAHR